jgi:hypothetical protein
MNHRPGFVLVIWLLIAVCSMVVESCASNPAIPETAPNCALRAEPTARKIEKGSGITPPKAIYRLEPIAPPTLRTSVTAVLGAVIGEDGIPRHVCFMDGNEEWASAASDAFKHWRFEPATRDGRPVAVLFTLTMRLRRD